MKRIILSLVAVLTIGLVAAQEKTTFGFTKGNVFVEGNLQYSDTEVDLAAGSLSDVTRFAFTPSVGYFVSDDFAVGLGLRYESIKNAGSKERAYGASAFGRYYFLDLGKRFKTYGQANLGYLRYKDADVNNMSANIDLGINNSVTENFAINFKLGNIVGYDYYKGDGDSASNFNFNLNEFNNFFSENATFGLTYKF